MTDDELGAIEAAFYRFATDEDMPQVEWDAMIVRIAGNGLRLLAEVRRLRDGIAEALEDYDCRDELGAIERLRALAGKDT